MIELENISKNYTLPNSSPVCALDQLSVTIGKGEWVAITGPSGSGKSTLMNIIGLLDRPDTGSYRLVGLDVAGLDDRGLSRLRAEKLGFVFQAFHLLPALTTAENVALPLTYRPNFRAPQSAEALLEKVGLADRIHHRPGELSGGQQQRVAIARALIGDPEVILADEPTGNLDSQAGEEILNLLGELNKAGRTVVMVTHDPVVAARAARIVRVHDGKVAYDGPPEQVAPPAVVEKEEKSSPQG